MEQKKKNKRQRILVVDDAPNTLEIVRRNLEIEGYDVLLSKNVEEALLVLKTAQVDLVITDIKMPRISGLDLVKYVHENLKDTEVMVITGFASVEGAVEAVKAGAEEYLPKPFTDKELVFATKKALDKLKMRRSSSAATSIKGGVAHGIIGGSIQMQKVFEMIDKASTNNATVLITGESGTGKDLVARAIHYSSKRASAPFLPVNCGGIPEGLLESEFFGYVKGAFTGATESRAGFFQTADKGTIFLDEISNTSLTMQAKLLRVLQDKEVYMVGATKSRKIDVRIIAATNKNLLSMVEKEAFREDLYFRLNVIAINIPPLRDRLDDIARLAKFFIDKYSKEYEKEPPMLTDKALYALQNYAWPGNVRELENVIQRIVLMTDVSSIDVADLPRFMRFKLNRDSSYKLCSIAESEQEHIERVLKAVKNNKTKAAEVLGIDRKTLREKLKKYEN